MTRRKAVAPASDLGTARVRPLPVEQVCAKGDLCIRASNGLLFVAQADIVPARRVRFGACRSAEGIVVYESGPWLVIVPDHHRMPVVQHQSWCEEITEPQS